MGDLVLRGHTGFSNKEVLPDTRQVKEGVDLDTIKNCTNNNNLDEVVVKDAKGELYVTFADELSVRDVALPKIGDKVNLPFLDEAGKPRPLPARPA